MTNVIELKNKTDYDNLVKNNKKCIIFYSAEKCKFCKELYPFYERISNRYHKKCKFAYVDIMKIGMVIEALPAFAIIYNGSEIDNISTSDKFKMKEIITKLLKK